MVRLIGVPAVICPRSCRPEQVYFYGGLSKADTVRKVRSLLDSSVSSISVLSRVGVIAIAA
eukprot:16447652-Heterocapsa_arctica.AAC.1